MKVRNSRRRYFVALIICWVLSRCFYFFYLGVRLDAGSLGSYLQYIDPVLLKTALWQSTFYLNNQPPGFNLFLGVMLQAFGSHAGWAFQVAYFGFGLGLAIALLALLLRLGIFPALAFLTTAWFCLSPITVLYENWLFYTYPLTFLLVLSALFLHRYIVGQRTADAVLFFSTMAVIVLTRGIFHLAWLVLPVLALWLIRPRFRRQVVLASALPCLFVVALYLKNYLVFGTVVSGRVYQNANIGMMVFSKVTEPAKEDLIAAGKVTALAKSNPYHWLEVEEYRNLLPPIKRWGIPVLDQEVKSTGVPNWQSQVIAEFAQLYYRDAIVAVRQYPMAYLQAVIDNLGQYLIPADETLPFYDTPSSDAQSMRMRRLLSAWHVLFAGRPPLPGFAGKVPWLNLIAFASCFLFGCDYVRRWWSSCKRVSESCENARWKNANGALILFMLYNIAYLAAVTMLFSVADHSRYRFKVSPFYAVLFSLLVAFGVRLVAQWRSGNRRESSGRANKELQLLR